MTANDETTETPPPTPADIAARTADKTYTQADVDRLVKEGIRKVHEAHADYDEVRAKAEAAAQLEATVNNIETELSRLQRQQLLTGLMSSHGLSDDDLPLLTGDDEATLIAQAERLSQLRVARSNIAPREGHTVNIGKSEDRDVREFVNDLFGVDEY